MRYTQWHVEKTMMDIFSHQRDEVSCLGQAQVGECLHVAH